MACEPAAKEAIVWGHVKTERLAAVRCSTHWLDVHGALRILKTQLVTFGVPFLKVIVTGSDTKLLKERLRVTVPS